MESISKEEAAYIAGIIDGEGCLQVGVRTTPHRTLRPVIEVGNTCPYMIRRLSELYTKLGVVYHIAYGQSRKSDYLRVAVGGQGSLLKLLGVIEPYLVTKREQAQLMIEFLLWRRTQPLRSGDPVIRGEVIRKYEKLRDDLKVAHARRWHLQRLPRRASQPLDLSNLEAKV